MTNYNDTIRTYYERMVRLADARLETEKKRIAQVQKDAIREFKRAKEKKRQKDLASLKRHCEKHFPTDV